MKKIILSSFMVITLTVGYGFAQMGGGMMGGGRMGGQQDKVKQGDMTEQEMLQWCRERMGSGMKGGMTGSGMMGGGMMGGGMMGGMGMMGRGMGPKEQKFLDGTVSIRKEFNQKRFEYFEALRNPKTTPESLTKLEKELLELQKKIYEKGRPAFSGE